MTTPPPTGPTSTETAPSRSGAETHWLFLRALAFVHLWAFGSFWVQLQGLIGPSGIRPASETLERARIYFEQSGESAWRSMPTLAWFTGTDAMALHLLCATGVLAALALLFNRWATPALLVLFGVYLSLFHVGAEFLRYQWDLLLLEVTFASLFYTPRFRPGVWLPRLILFKLMFSSGVVKLASGDPTWRDLTALDFHYWTQPIPHFGGWLAWQAPGHAVSCLLMFGVELLVPLLIFIRPAWAFWPFLGLLAVMAGTGNYGFFHILSATLCVTLVPDATWRRWLRGRIVVAAPPSAATGLGRWATRALALPLLWLGALSLLHLGLLGQRRAPPAALTSAYDTLIGPFDAWQLENSYGLFASMTTSRREIQVEGTNDGGQTWRPYRFAYKPLDAHDMPPPALFHLPRLDWQMWFAALGTCRRNEWFVLFQKRLLEGSAPVLALLAENPFPDGPPTQIRTRTEDFRFAEAARDGLWKITPGGPYCPPLTLSDFGPPESKRP